MASVIKAGNATDGVQVTSDNTGILELKTGTGSGTTAMTIGTGQNVTFAQAANLPNTFGFKNRIINGAMVIDQRNAGASVTPTTSGYTLDRWGCFLTQSSKFSVQQNAGSVTPPSGFTNYLGVTSTSAYSVGAGDTFFLFHRIEGFNTADLMWGTANAQTVTLSFWVRSSLTGTFGGSLQNSAENRSYPFTYTISAANTWEQKSLTIAGDTSGTWLTNNGRGVQIAFNLGTGSTYNGTAGAWASSQFFSATGAVSVVGTNGATFYITGVQLEKGSTATSFDYRPYSTELQLAQRYYFKQWNTTANNARVFLIGAFNATRTFGGLTVPVPLRASPTISFGAGTHVKLETIDLGTNFSVTAITVFAAPNGFNANVIPVEINVASGLTGGTIYNVTLMGGSSTLAFYELSAEL